MKKMFSNVAEIGVVYKPTISDKPIITSSLDAYNVLVNFFPSETLCLQERFVAMYLNRSNRVIGVYHMSTGGITGTVVDVRLLLSVALKTAATGIIIGHNHPSNNLQPSNTDKQLTRKIKEGCSLLDLQLLDHLIITSVGYLSFSEQGHL
jgi:DNA repair protein RadC